MHQSQNLDSRQQKADAISQIIEEQDLALEDKQVAVLLLLVAKNRVNVAAVKKIDRSVYTWLPSLAEVNNQELLDYLLDSIAVTLPFISPKTKALLSILSKQNIYLSDKDSRFGGELLNVNNELLFFIEKSPELIPPLKQIFIETDGSTFAQTKALTRLLKICTDFKVDRQDHEVSRELNTLLKLCRAKAILFSQTLSGIDNGLSPEVLIEFVKRDISIEVIALRELAIEQLLTGDSKLAVLFSDIANFVDDPTTTSDQSLFKDLLARTYKEVINLYKEHSIPIDKYYRLCSDTFTLFKKELCIREDLEDVLLSARFFVSEGLVLDYLDNPNLSSHPSLSKFWIDWVHPDILPVIPGERENTLFLKQSLQVMRRAYDMSFSFWNLKHETQRVSDDNDPLFKRAICDLFGNIQEVINREPNNFPGKGWVFESLDMPRAFSRSFREQFKNIAFDHHEAADFDQLANCRFGFLRGLIFVSNPNSQHHIIAGTHYSYVVFNEHFGALPCDRAFLIPTEVLFDTINQCLSPVKGDLVKSSRFRSAHEVIPTPLTLYENSLLPSANLSWSSNITGSLSNAFAPGVLANEWQNDKSISGDWGAYQDENGFMTKSFINNGWSGHEDLVMLHHLFAPLKKQHNQVYRVATSLQNHLDHFKLLLRQWHFGLTLSSEANRRNEQEISFSSETNTDKAIFNPHAARLLYEAYKWHANYGDNSKNPDPLRCPVLSTCSTDRYGAKPTQHISLDTYSMVLEFQFGDARRRMQLSSSASPTEMDLLMWSSYVLNYKNISGSGEERHILRDIWTDMRFFSREDLIEKKI